MMLGIIVLCFFLASKPSFTVPHSGTHSCGATSARVLTSDLGGQLSDYAATHDVGETALARTVVTQCSDDARLRSGFGLFFSFVFFLPGLVLFAQAKQRAKLR